MKPLDNINKAFNGSKLPKTFFRFSKFMCHRPSNTLVAILLHLNKPSNEEFVPKNEFYETETRC